MKAAPILRLTLLLAGILTISHGLLAAGSSPVLFKGEEVRPDQFLAKWKDSAASSRSVQPQDRASAAFSAVADLADVENFPNLDGITALRMVPPAVGKAVGPKGGKAKAPDIQSRLDELMATGLFEFVEPDYIVHALATPTDSAFSDGRLWGLRNLGQNGGISGADIGAPAAWDVTTGSTVVIVAVIDTGIRYTHQDLAANMWRNPGETPNNGIDDDGNGYIDDVFGINAVAGNGNPFDDNDHGSHCAGTIGAVANGGGPHVGVAWNVRLMALKFLAANGSGALSDAIECIDYAISKGARITNNSWGGGGSSEALRQAIARANAANILFIAAAGNESSDNDRVASFPSNYDVPNVVAVAALDRRDGLANFSNFGATQVDLGAPGVDIFSCTSTSDTSYASFNGTSMAAPHVAGVAALLAARFPNASVAELKNRLLSSAVPVPALAGKCVTGGRVNAPAALGAAADGVLELSISPARVPLPSAVPTNVFVAVSDFTPTTNATVTAPLAGGGSVTFRDNGLSPDAQAGDGTYTAAITPPANTTSLTLNVSASAPGKSAAQRAATFAVVNPPANDNFAAASPTTPGGVRSTGTNVNASRETGEALNPTAAGGRTVWWTWQAPATASVTISTTGSDFDTTLAIYTGSSLGGLTLVGANDDADGLQSAVTFNATGGTTYRVQVDGYSNNTGNIVLNHPSSGNPNGAPVIVTEPGDTSVLVGSPLSLRVVAQNAQTYQWYFEDAQIPGATAATFTKTAATLDDQGEYYVVVGNASGQTPSRRAFVAVERVQVGPGNDAFAKATLLTGGTGRVTDSNQQATGEPGEPDHAGVSQPLASIWYRWQASGAGAVTFDTEGSDFDTVLAVYQGTALANLTEVASNDDTDGSNRQSAVNFTAAQGATYWIAVDGFDAAQGSIVLNYALAGTDPDASNDDFADRRPLVTPTDSRSNVGATGETGEPNHADTATPLSSLWWTWQAPADGEVSFDTSGSDFDTTLAAYEGARVDQLTEVAANDDFGSGLTSQISFRVTAGGVYAIAVDGYGTSEGLARLNVLFQPDSAGTPGSGSPTIGDPVVFSDRPRQSVRDRRTTFVSADIEGAGVVTTVRISFKIRHSYRGDLRLDLIAPDGRRIRIFRGRRNDGRNNVVVGLTTDDFAGSPIRGAWRLKIKDRFRGDKGRLLRWKLVFNE